MLSLTSKKYEVEEKVEIKDENGVVLYEFNMQITADELKRIREMIVDESYKIGKLKNDDKIMEKSLKLQEEFENICFKEHKEPFKKVNSYKYIEMVDLMYDFFIKMFINKRAQQVNTINTSLHKITSN